MYMRGKGHIFIPSTLLGTVYLPQYKGVEKHLNILSKNKVTTWENGKIEEVQYSQWGSLKISSNTNYHTSNTCGNLAGCQHSTWAEFAEWKAQRPWNCPLEQNQGTCAEGGVKGSLCKCYLPTRGKEPSLFQRSSSNEPCANLNKSWDSCKRAILICSGEF